MSDFHSPCSLIAEDYHTILCFLSIHYIRPPPCSPYHFPIMKLPFRISRRKRIHVDNSPYQSLSLTFHVQRTFISHSTQITTNFHRTTIYIKTFQIKSFQIHLLTFFPITVINNRFPIYMSSFPSIKPVQKLNWKIHFTFTDRERDARKNRHHIAPIHRPKYILIITKNYINNVKCLKDCLEGAHEFNFDGLTNFHSQTSENITDDDDYDNYLLPMKHAMYLFLSDCFSSTTLTTFHYSNPSPQKKEGWKTFQCLKRTSE